TGGDHRQRRRLDEAERGDHPVGAGRAADGREQRPAGQAAQREQGERDSDRDGRRGPLGGEPEQAGLDQPERGPASAAAGRIRRTARHGRTPRGGAGAVAPPPWPGGPAAVASAGGMAAAPAACALSLPCRRVGSVIPPTRSSAAAGGRDRAAAAIRCVARRNSAVPTGTRSAPPANSAGTPAATATAAAVAGPAANTASSSTRSAVNTVFSRAGATARFSTIRVTAETEGMQNPAGAASRSSSG